MKVFINVETEGKNKEELTAEIVMAKSFAIKKITELFPSVKADKDVEFVDTLGEAAGTTYSKHGRLEKYANLLLTLSTCDLLINTPKLCYGGRNGSNAIENAARDFGVPVVVLGLNDYNDPSKGMYVDAFEHYHIHDRRRPGSRNVIAYSKYNREMNYEEEE